TSILCAQDGRVWVGSEDGVVVLEERRVRQRFGLDDGLPARSIAGLHQDRSGRIWVWTGEGAAQYVDGRFHPVLVGKMGLAAANVFSIGSDDRGLVWFGTENGVTRYDGKVWSSLNSQDWGVAFGQEVRSVAQDAHGRYWFATE